MKIELSEEEVKEILTSWLRVKTPDLREKKITVHQLYHEGSLAAAIEVDAMPERD